MCEFHVLFLSHCFSQKGLGWTIVSFRPSSCLTCLCFMCVCFWKIMVDGLVREDLVNLSNLADTVFQKIEVVTLNVCQPLYSERHACVHFVNFTGHLNTISYTPSSKSNHHHQVFCMNFFLLVSLVCFCLCCCIASLNNTIRNVSKCVRTFSLFTSLRFVKHVCILITGHWAFTSPITNYLHAALSTFLFRW